MSASQEQKIESQEQKIEGILVKDKSGCLLPMINVDIHDSRGKLIEENVSFLIDTGFTGRVGLVSSEDATKLKVDGLSATGNKAVLFNNEEVNVLQGYIYIKTSLDRNPKRETVTIPGKVGENHQKPSALDKIKWKFKSITLRKFNKTRYLGMGFLESHFLEPCELIIDVKTKKVTIRVPLPPSQT
jgi:predicted aspartyl protease